MHVQSPPSCVGVSELSGGDVPFLLNCRSLLCPNSALGASPSCVLVQASVFEPPVVDASEPIVSCGSETKVSPWCRAFFMERMGPTYVSATVGDDKDHVVASPSASLCSSSAAANVHRRRVSSSVSTPFRPSRELDCPVSASLMSSPFPLQLAAPEQPPANPVIALLEREGLGFDSRDLFDSAVGSHRRVRVPIDDFPHLERYAQRSVNRGHSDTETNLKVGTLQMSEVLELSR